MLPLHPVICQKTSSLFNRPESTPTGQPFPLSPRERAGVRGNSSPDHLTLPNALASLHEPAPPHPYPLPRGEGTAKGPSLKCKRIPCYLCIQSFARKPPAYSTAPKALPPANHSPSPQGDRKSTRLNSS